MKLVILESPFAADTQEVLDLNITYARECLRDSLMRGEAPIASHLLYTQPGVLRDGVPSERQHGIDAGLAWRKVAEASVVYADRGISNGMKYGIQAALDVGIPVQVRHIHGETSKIDSSTGLQTCDLCKLVFFPGEEIHFVSGERLHASCI